MILRGPCLAAAVSSGGRRGIATPSPRSGDLEFSLWLQDMNENLVRSKHIGVGVVVAACKH